MFFKFQICFFILFSCFLVCANQVSQAELDEKLLQAAKMGDIEGARSALEAGANPTARDGKNKTPLHSVSLSFEMASLLLEAGADPNAQDDNGDTPLQNTFLSTRTARLLLEKEADPNIQNNLGEIPLHNQFLSPSLVRLHLEFEANPNTQNNKEKIPIEQPAFARNPRIIKLHLEFGADTKGIPIHEIHPSLHLSLEHVKFNPEEVKKEEEEASASDTEDDLALDDVEKNSEVLESPSELQEKKEDICQYTTEPSQIKVVQCGGRRVCMAEVSCIFKIGFTRGGDSNKTQITRSFQAVCSSLSNGQCPKAVDCVIDRSVVSAEDNHHPPLIAPIPQNSSSSGIR